ncbi:hypothetical protein WA1_27235 [Scytonema hofmannii PCC 7110]|uniref:Filamentous haemagglutinin FhaB/tRNA nuclease CdiA-like TPS domain-containing protein n=1 Tax=Scytonema hofmannii PCC 7110 TaxID=128403 RepID=A0A139X6H8_9CYAN|nr:filamentous hemagglutinin N-terminal domain-containing protein [Scytonema hofmannii]KYC40233.1 hypothetical protein WA1_27235 [Scytonema hofmannii PCC 7110]
MTRRTRNWYWLRVGIGLIAVGGSLFCRSIAIAQNVPDSTLGTESSVVTPNVDVKGLASDRIDGGAVRGSGLFHSFQEFNVGEGRGAYFNNPAGVENIFSRVTGTNASNIFGKLGVLGNANLFLLNPNGIIFGPNASLDIKGSFSASTANSLNFGDGKLFSATNPTAPPLLSVTVPLGVQFNQQQPKAIANSGNLSVGTGQNLTLLGGTVASTGQLSAPSGQVAIAAVPGGSVVNLSPLAQLLNIETSSPVASVGSSSLGELLTSVDEKSHPGLTVNGNGQVELAGSGLSVVDGDVVARNVTAQTATLTANNNLTLVESQIGTTGDLNLLAGNTVRVRDSVANPFVAQAGGQLLVQGKQGVDIFALNHPSSGLVSGRDMVLRSANTVGGDAHYWTGGSFRIEKLDGSLGGLFSPYDPIIRASGDVSFNSYTGGSLHILAGGSVNIGTVEITAADGTNGLVQTVFLSDDDPNGDHSFVEINGRNFPTLDIRAGTTDFGTPPFTPSFNFPGNGTINPNPPNITPVISANTQQTGANISIGSIINGRRGGQIFLTNQYQRNPNLPNGSIEITGEVPTSTGPTSIAAFGNPVTIDARGDVRIDPGINTSISEGQGGDIKILSRGIINVGRSSVRNSLTAGSDSGDGGNITLSADKNITTNGDIRSFISAGGSGDGGNISIISGTGNINTVSGEISSVTANGNAGNIELIAPLGNITTANVSSFVSAGGTGTGGDISIISGTGNINTVSGVISSVTANGNAGNIELIAPLGNITTANVSSFVSAGGTGTGGDISIISGTGNINTVSGVISSTTANGNAGYIELIAPLGNITTANVNSFVGARGTGNGGNIILRSGVTQIGENIEDVTVSTGLPFGFGVINTTRGSINSATENGISGNVILQAANNISSGNIESFSTNNRPEFSEVRLESLEGSVFLDRVRLSTTNSGSGFPGDITILANDRIEIIGNNPVRNQGSIPDIESNGDFGIITIAADGNVSLKDTLLSAIVPPNQFSRPNPQQGEESRQAGEIDVISTSGNIEITNSDLTARTESQFANPGNIEIIARGNVLIQQNSLVRTNIEQNAGVVRETNSSNGDDVEYGNINIFGNSLEIRGSEVTTTSASQVQAGSVIVIAPESFILSGTSFTDFSLELNNPTPQTVQRRPGLFAEATGKDGTAGEVGIVTNKLRIENGSQVTVSSREGKAGNVIVLAKEISLNNGALFATTGQDIEDRTTGGNIFLLSEQTVLDTFFNLFQNPDSVDKNRLEEFQSRLNELDSNLESLILNNKFTKEELPGSPLDFLHLGNESLIAANALNNARGGNVAIKTRVLLGLPPTRDNGSDISANAQEGRGGEIAIDTRPLGTYGIEFRPKTTSSNDITASSETGSAGIVSIRLPDVDPRRGFLPLPEDLGDSSRFIDPSCPVGGKRARSRFVVTGRGGLPPSPSSVINSDILLGGSGAIATPPENNSSAPIVEAQGVKIGPKGEIILAANPSQLSSSYSPWQPFTRGCYEK